MGLFGSDSNSATSTNTAASDQARISTGSSQTGKTNIRGSNTQYTEAGALSVGQKGTYLTGQASNLTGADVKGNLSVSTSDPEVTKAALSALSSGSSDVVKSATDLAKNAADSQTSSLNSILTFLSGNNKAAFSAVSDAQSGASGLVNTALGSMSDITQAQQSGGASIAASNIKSILLWGLGIVGIVIVLLAWGRKKA